MVKRHTKDIDDEFALVVVLNQVHFYRSGYRFRHFTFQDPKNLPENNVFSVNVHKYINRVVEERLELYKQGMRYIEHFHINKVVGTRFHNMLENVCRKFNNKGYSHENFMVACADLCTFTRCAFLQGLTSSYWPRYLLAEVLLYMRLKNSFSDLSYRNLNEWLSNQVANNEEYTWPEQLNPVKLSLEWVGCPRSSNLGSLFADSSSSSSSSYSPSSFKDKFDRSVAENFGEGVPEGFKNSEKRRKLEIPEDLKQTSEETVEKETDVLGDESGHSETSGNK